MGDEHDRLGESSLQAQQLALQVGTHHRIHRGEGFVHQQDGRIGGESTRHTNALHLATRELGGVALSIRRIQADHFKQFERASLRLLAGGAEQARYGGNILRDGAVRHEPALLHDVANTAA